ncbi:MAG: two-partner secretion domain-containing protein, partial [Planctomycetota bacterium]
MKTFAHDPFVKIAHKSIAYILVFCVVNMPVWAISGHQLVAGSAGFTSGNDYLVNLSSDRAVINWDNFDAINGQGITFTGPGSFAVLNRVVAGGATNFDGYLNGNQGHILLINPQGIVFGPNASISAARFTASTMHLVDDENFSNFMSSSNTFEFAKGGADPAAQIALLAGSEITAQRVELLAQKITNAGTITTGPGGIVAMVAGDRVLLGESGSNIIVEMDSATGVVADTDTDFGTISGGPAGSVTNTIDGTITSPGGQVVLAAGDIFSAALQDEGERAVKVHWGNGTVTQNGEINTNITEQSLLEDSSVINGGIVSLTAGDATTLGTGSKTYANAGTDGESGLVSVHSKGTTDVKSEADIQATGGYTPTSLKTDPTYVDGLPDDQQLPSVAQIIQKNSVQIIGDTILLDGSIDATSADLTKKGKIWIEADSLIIAEYLDNPENTVLIGFIENQSLAGVDVELVSHASEGTITTTLPASNKGWTLEGGSGDITLRTLYANGGINLTLLDGKYLDFATDPSDGRNGGNIFMMAGSGGITVGDISTSTLSSDKIVDPGRIRLLTGNGGVINSGSLIGDSGSVVEVSAIASGDLYVNGKAVATTNSTGDNLKEIAFARICLVSENGKVTLDGTGLNGNNYAARVYSKGKTISNADILICAGTDIELINLDKGIDAVATLAQKNENAIARAAVTITAGGLDESLLDPSPASGTGQILIDGQIVTDLKTLPVTVSAQTAGNGSALTATPLDDQQNPDDPDTVTVVKTPPADSSGREWVEIHVDRDFAELDPESNEPCPDCPCANCPKPPGFLINIFATDDEAMEHMNTPVETVIGTNPTDREDSVFWNDYLAGSTLTIVEFANLREYIVDNGSLTPTGREVNGTLEVIDATAGTFKYTPEAGYAGYSEGEQKVIVFDYLAIDDNGILVDATVTVMLTNELLPTGAVTLENASMDTTGETLNVAGGSGDFTDADGDYFDIISIVKATDDNNKIYGGTLDYEGDKTPYESGDTYYYIADPTLPGYVGEDDFDVQLWDGEYLYSDFDDQGN